MAWLLAGNSKRRRKSIRIVDIRRKDGGDWAVRREGRSGSSSVRRVLLMPPGKLDVRAAPGLPIAAVSTGLEQFLHLISPIIPPDLKDRVNLLIGQDVCGHNYPSCAWGLKQRKSREWARAQSLCKPFQNEPESIANRSYRFVKSIEYEKSRKPRKGLPAVYGLGSGGISGPISSGRTRIRRAGTGQAPPSRVVHQGGSPRFSQL